MELRRPIGTGAGETVRARPGCSGQSITASDGSGLPSRLALRYARRWKVDDVGLFKSGRELNRLADECTELAGMSTEQMMRLTGKLAAAVPGPGRVVTRGEVMILILESLRLLDETRSGTMAGMVMADRFDAGEITDHRGRPLRDRLPTAVAAQTLVYATQEFRPQYWD